ncbi:MAG: phosphatase PAP2 family protein [Clostridia bacterium]|nr:phosphatase PAP2 family protein [Clostridia bacterium]
MKRKTWLYISLSVLLVALMAVASVWDLDIARAVASLAEGEYYSDNAFGVVFEVIGVAPIYIAVILACIVIFSEADAIKGSLFWRIITAIAGMVMGWYMYSTIIGYVGDHLGNSALTEGVVANILLALAGIITTGGLYLLSLKVDSSIKRKLLVWAFVVLFAAIIGKVLTEILKGMAGRMRYRAMWAEGDYAGYTPWYEWVGKRKPTAEQVAMGMPSDIYKSFPSGHTSAATMSIVFGLIPHALGVQKKSTISWVWIVSIAFPILVAVSRMVVGAHFLSDVTIGALTTVVGYVVGLVLSPIVVKALTRSSRD